MKAGNRVKKLENKYNVHPVATVNYKDGRKLELPLEEAFSAMKSGEAFRLETALSPEEREFLTSKYHNEVVQVLDDHFNKRKAERTAQNKG